MKITLYKVAFGMMLVAGSTLLYWIAGKDIPTERGADAFFFYLLVLTIFIGTLTFPLD